MSGYVDPTAETVEELQAYLDEILARIPEEWDDDAAPQAIINRWLDAVTARLEAADPAGHAWLFLGGDDPRPEADR